MSNIAVKKETPAPRPMMATAPDWEPSRLMRQFFGWDPFKEMAPLMRAEPVTFSPAFEVKEAKDGYMFRADVPGVKESDLEITFAANRLTIAGKREAEKEEKTDTYYMFERNYGSFTRSFTLPADIDANKIHADMRDGVLTVYVPRTAASMPKKIAVQSGGATSKS